MADGQIDAAAVKAAVAGFKDPESGRSILKFEQVNDIQFTDNELSLTLALTTWSAPIWNDVREALAQRLRNAFPQLSSVTVKQTTQDRPAQKIGEVGLTTKSAIAIASGKGGVGKSTIAACVALGLNRSGSKVGLMDSDVYGPSIPHLLGLSESPVVENNQLVPVEKNGMPIMSMGFMVPKDEAVMWRGPMLHGAVTQFLRDTRWGDLDYLFIDMPPGTGDVALTLSQLLPLTGAIVVCTPQDVALLDAVKAIAMFRKVNIPVLGIVENMSGFVCPGCGERHDIFGSGGARQQAEALNVPFLGEMPINLLVRQNGDEGKTEATLDNPAVASSLDGICYRLVKNLATAAEETPPQPQLSILS